MTYVTATEKPWRERFLSPFIAEDYRAKKMSVLHKEITVRLE